MNFVDVTRRCAVYIGAITGVKQLLVYRIEVEDVVVLLVIRRHELVAQTGIDSQLWKSLPVVLDVPKMPEAKIVHFVGRVERVIASGSEQKVGEISGLYSRCRARGTVLTGIRVRTELRMEI
jgi:hypothetical protein